jgi:hypothetical protein
MLRRVFGRSGSTACQRSHADLRRSIPDAVGARRCPRQIADIFSISRMSSPGSGCLQCNRLIPAWRLTEEATDQVQRHRQRYVDDDDVHAPSVITLNAVAASRAVDDWLIAR